MHKITALFLLAFFYTFAVQSGSNAYVWVITKDDYVDASKSSESPDAPYSPVASYLEENFR